MCVEHGPTVPRAQFDVHGRPEQQDGRSACQPDASECGDLCTRIGVYFRGGQGRAFGGYRGHGWLWPAGGTANFADRTVACVVDNADPLLAGPAANINKSVWERHDPCGYVVPGRMDPRLVCSAVRDALPRC